MSAVSYMVTVTLPNEAMAKAFLAWLQGGHVAEVLAGGASRAQIVSLDQTAHTFEIRYRFPSRESFERYERECAPRLRADGLQRFPMDQGVVYRRTSGAIVDER
jgi:Domain of unknown function (DUF4286)